MFFVIKTLLYRTLRQVDGPIGINATTNNISIKCVQSITVDDAILVFLPTMGYRYVFCPAKVFLLLGNRMFSSSYKNACIRSILNAMYKLSSQSNSLYVRSMEFHKDFGNANHVQISALRHYSVGYVNLFALLNLFIEPK